MYYYAEMNDLTLPEGATTWNARAITGYGSVDLVPDRQEAKGPHKDALIARLNDGVLHQALHEAATRLKNGQMSPAREGTHVLYSDVRFEVRGNTNGSYGYLYLCAFDKSEVINGSKS